ncbi:RES family NAD+ phosphorylase [Polynucleobacter sp. AP-Feld-500C-C5]|uniref:RES family NAD+ phosphorylase n=1 Tax=Polynucleobacter sp. AP-Feld-500C-C5 TaxID=2576924 RepID=UPI001C0C4D1A|nr:RES family NAD+ phosphorylase [Polynucleobacter sp. AP-Feld-500C-C5]MBU3632332.1 RES family NAD+ phosphorylase [Polynucleobacter sp. AP-Feld-500C-C5]
MRNKTNVPRGILELERFTEASITQWNHASENLNELEDVLYFNLEPERRRLRPELIASLQCITPLEFEIKNWSRIVSYEYSAEPLSCLGSIKSYGGRFNVGQELGSGTLSPWPALYIAETYETAFREKRQIASNSLTEGLSPSELALQPGENLTSISIQGKLQRVFDMRMPKTLEPISKVLKKIKMPDRAKVLQKQLRISARDLFMITSSKQLHNAISQSNWRTLPIQFGLPSQSQIIAELVKSAGFEAILYPSSKATGNCLAIFAELLIDHSYIEIAGKKLDIVKHPKLDVSSAPYLMGNELIKENP